MHKGIRSIAVAALVAAAALATVVSVATPQPRGRDPEGVVTKTDAGKAKLDDDLRTRVDRGRR